MSIKKKISETIEKIKATDINGCITGSCMLDVDFDAWDTPPDIDIFVYSETSMVHAMLTIEGLGFKPGGKGKTIAGEETKRQWIIDTGVNKNAGLSTVMYKKDGVYINITLKKYCNSVIDVISTFDMSIIMIGYDIRNNVICDLREANGNTYKVAKPNPFKFNLNDHPSRFEVWRCLRQWDRVIKYYGRGYDTRPMAEYYLKCIDDVLEAGAIFQTERDITSFEEMEPGFTSMRKTISEWLDEHKED